MNKKSKEKTIEDFNSDGLLSSKLVLDVLQIPKKEILNQISSKTISFDL